MFLLETTAKMVGEFGAHTIEVIKQLDEKFKFNENCRPNEPFRIITMVTSRREQTAIFSEQWDTANEVTGIAKLVDDCFETAICDDLDFFDSNDDNPKSDNRDLS